MLCVECCLNALLSRTAAGVQLIGQRFREDLVLDAMEQVETRVGVLIQQLWACLDMT